MELLESLILTLINIYRYLMLGYILLSWVPNARESFIGELLGKLVEPYLSPFRKVIPPIGMIDISPIVAFIVLFFLQLGVVEVFNMLG